MKSTDDLILDACSRGPVSVAEIVASTGLSRRTVERAKDELEFKGFLIRSGKGRETKYASPISTDPRQTPVNDPRQTTDRPPSGTPVNGGLGAGSSEGTCTTTPTVVSSINASPETPHLAQPAPPSDHRQTPDEPPSRLTGVSREEFDALRREFDNLKAQVQAMQNNRKILTVEAPLTREVEQQIAEAVEEQFKQKQDAGEYIFDPSGLRAYLLNQLRPQVIAGQRYLLDSLLADAKRRTEAPARRAAALAEADKREAEMERFRIAEREKLRAEAAADPNRAKSRIRFKAEPITTGDEIP